MSPKKNFPAASEAATVPDIFAKNWRLATQSLAEIEQKFESKDAGRTTPWRNWQSEKGFPKTLRYTPADRYRFIDTYLKNLLDPKYYRDRNYMRPDLNGKNDSQRAWLLKKVLTRLVEEAQPNYAPAADTLIFPEDLGKVVEAMDLLRKHHGKLPAGPSRTLQYYQTAEALRAAVEPWRVRHPLSDRKREVAHRSFLKLNNSDGSPLYQGSGEAVRLAVLPGGAEVIQVKSEQASTAYGSPEWCTTGEGDSAYETYKHNLVIIINPAGERWQFHFSTMQFRDANDQQIENLQSFLDEYAGLARTLRPIVRQDIGKLVKAWENAREGEYHIKDILKRLADVPEWRESIIGAFFKAAGLNANVDRYYEVIDEIKNEPSWRNSVTKKVISSTLIQTSTVNFYLDHLRKVPAWVDGVSSDALRTVLVKASMGDEGRLFSVLSDISIEPAWREKALKLLDADLPQPLKAEMQDYYEHSLLWGLRKPAPYAIATP